MCTSGVPPDLKLWTEGLRNAVNAAARRATTIRTNTATNYRHLHKLAFKLLRASDYIAIPKDKEGGFVLTVRAELEECYNELLSSAVYRPACLPSTAEWRKEARAVCRHIANTTHNEQLYSDLTRTLYRGQHAVGRLQFKVKSHKEAANVTVRALHASIPYPLEGISRWLGGVVRDRLQAYDHLLVDSAALVKRWRGMTMAHTYRLGKIDVKDFFYSGTAQEIEGDLLRLFDRRPPPCFTRALRFILGQQFVCRPSDAKEAGGENPKGIFNVALGTGMGLPHSSDICDGTLTARLDTWLAKPGIRKATGLVDYVRFRDDLLFLYDSKIEGGYSKLKKAIFSMARYFTLKCDGEDMVETRFLELTIKLKHCRAYFSYTAKEMLGPPLGLESCHAPRILQSWPQGVTKRIRTLTTTSSDERDAIQVFVNRFCKFDVPWQDVSGPKALRTAPRQQTEWVPITHHPCTARLISTAISQFCSRHKTLTSSLFEGPKHICGTVAGVFRPAWRNAGAHLIHRLRMEGGRG